ncbi:MAG TPA: glycosyltransferase family 9 protein [Chloroflexia bacterium]|nr:glycosyltransferase family 9 protein [Chloroflexia bacterium]
MSTRAIDNILLCALLPIGDTLFTTPAIRAVRARYPRARIIALTYPTNSGILESNPDVDQIWLVPTRQRLQGGAALARLVTALRGAHFDLTLEFSNYNYGLRYWLGSARTYTMQLPRLWWVRPGAGRHWRRHHAVEHYTNVARRAGIPVADWRLRIYSTLREVAAGDQLLRDHGVRSAEPVIGIHPGGEGLWGRKKWAPRGFAAVADHLHAQFGVKIVVLGGKEDARLAAEVAALSTAPVLNLAGQTTLGATAALAARCVLFIGNDSSPLHIAVAAGTRVVGIYGLTDPRSYRPWVPGGRAGQDYAVVLSPAPCAACFPLVGGITLPEWVRCVRCNALAAITPAQVVAAATPLLAAALR